MKASRIAAAAAVAGASVLLLATPSFAHVTVQAEGEAAKGGYTTIDFKVPNERDNASTTRIEVNLPTDHPLASVMPEPVSGWHAQITRTKLAKPLELEGEQVTEAVTKITWIADGKGIEPGFFQKFPLSVGPLPKDTDQLVFKALQTYSDKQVVRWIEVPQKGQEEPESPAPVLRLTAAGSSSAGGSTAGAEDSSSDGAGGSTGQAASAGSTSSGGSDTTARVLGIVGIVVGAAGLTYGLFAGRRRGQA